MTLGNTRYALRTSQPTDTGVEPDYETFIERTAQYVNRGPNDCSFLAGIRVLADGRTTLYERRAVLNGKSRTILAYSSGSISHDRSSGERLDLGGESKEFASDIASALRAKGLQLTELERNGLESKFSISTSPPKP